jgi:hypothetical protein
MNIRKSATILGAILAASLAGAPSTYAQSTSRDQARTQTQEQIYGSQLMTQQEMNEYRERMRLAKTEQEREKIRADHHARMQDRAMQRGVKLPDGPPAKSGGMGPGGGGVYGPGGGTGSGGGGGGRR